MSVDGYLGPNKTQIGQPEQGGVAMPDGICYRESVQEMIQEMKYPELARRHRREDCGDEFYDSVEDYDPVLAWHCRK